MQLEVFTTQVRTAAEEEGVWQSSFTLSLPVIVSAENPALLTFVYHLEPVGNDNGLVHSPEYIVIVKSGQVSMTKTSAARLPLGMRFTGPAAEMTPRERTAFTLTYFHLLTDPTGLLRNRTLSPEMRSDLRVLFEALVERPLMPLYQEHALSYLTLLFGASLERELLRSRG